MRWEMLRNILFLTFDGWLRNVLITRKNKTINNGCSLHPNFPVTWCDCVVIDFLAHQANSYWEWQARGEAGVRNQATGQIFRHFWESSSQAVRQTGHRHLPSGRNSIFCTERRTFRKFHIDAVRLDTIRCSDRWSANSPVRWAVRISVPVRETYRRSNQRVPPAFSQPCYIPTDSESTAE